MPGTYTHTTRADGSILTGSIYNADHQNHITFNTPGGCDDYSTNVAQMQSAADPGEVGSESLPTDLAGELQRIRKILVEITGKTYWYESPSMSLKDDSTFRILGSSDATKKLAFEVDGLTTGTTRTVTMPDHDLRLGITLAPEQASTSGTSIDFTGIPAGVRRIHVMFNEVSTNGTSGMRVQLGDADGFEVAGYAGCCDVTSASVSTSQWSTASGIDVQPASEAAGLYSGLLTLVLGNVAGFTWYVSGMLAKTSGTVMFHTTGRKALSAVLTQVRITTINGSDTFDAGAINISYE